MLGSSTTKKWKACVGLDELAASFCPIVWMYSLTSASSLTVGESIWNVQFDDWMFQMNDRVMLNKAVMSKFGIQLGEVALSFTKRST